MLIRDQRPTINFMESYRAHYGGCEDVVIRKLESLPGAGAAVRLTLACLRPDFACFRFSEQGQPAYASLDNTFRVDLSETREWEGTAQPVYDAGPGPVTYTIKLVHTSREDFRAQGIDAIGRVTVDITPPLEFEVRSPESWCVPAPTAEERRFAQATWGEAVAGAESDHDKAKALCKALCHELWPHSGAPIPEMQWYSALEMYRAMVSGKSKGFCTQFGMILVHACKCFGLIARNLHVERPIEYGTDRWLLMQGMHCTCEVFDRDLDHWIFMDPRFYCLGAYLGEEGPLSLGEFHLFMAQAHRRPRLRFCIYDMESGTEKRLPMEQCPRPDIHFYAGWHTVLHVGYN